jgi:hypothetical protein
LPVAQGGEIPDAGGADHGVFGGARDDIGGGDGPGAATAGPASAAPDGATPVGVAPAESAPAESAPAESAPAESAPPNAASSNPSDSPWTDAEVLSIRLEAAEAQLQAMRARLEVLEAAQSATAAGLSAGEAQLAALSGAVPAGAETHGGFLLRFLLGLGYTALWGECLRNDCGEADRYGERDDLPAGGLTIELGLAVTERFYWYWEFGGNFPEYFALGLGLGGYLADNWYIDASAGFRLFIGGYGALTVGREWWVSPQWGLGIALRGAVTGDTGLSPPSVATVWTMNFTATYN